MFRNISNRIFGDITLVFNRSEEYARNRLNILWFSIFANIIATLYNGYFFTGMLLKLGADDAYVGLVSIVTYACNIMAVLSPVLIERFARRKKIILISRGVYYLLLLGFITLIPFIGLDSGVKLTAILAIIAFVNIISAVTGNGLSLWHLQSMPQSVRSSFYSNLSLIIGILNMILLNIASLFVDYFRLQKNELMGIALLRAAAFVFAIIEIACLSRVKEYPYAPQEPKTSLRYILLNTLKDRRYRAVIAIIMLWTFTASIPGPFYQVYLLKNLKIGYSFLSVVNLLNIPVLLIAMPIWGRVIARSGDMKIMPLLSGMIALHYISLAFVTRANYQWLYPITVFYYFLIAAGIAQAVSQMPFKFLLEGNRNSYLSFFNTANTVAALLGTALGQLIVLSTGKLSFNLGGMPLGNKQIIMLVTGAAIVIGAIVMAVINRRLKSIRLNGTEVQTNSPSR